MTPLQHCEQFVSPEYVLACVAFFRAAGGAYEPRHLHRRLKTANAARAPDDPGTWLPPNPMASSCRKALDFLQAARAKFPEMPEEEFRERLIAALQRRGLAQFADEALFRESMENASCATTNG